MQKTAAYQRIFTKDHEEEQKQVMENFKNETGKLPDCNNKIKIETP
jgi:hypothetical protein